ncbi:MAG TPA: maltose O-acetyltransferase [Erysipelotrichaceae bacterium]|nr:maltose O-acetyltransferase [Erysipelotrichaceae bacterium]
MENNKKTEREKMTDGEPFFTNDPQLMEDKKNARILCSRLNSSPEDESLRHELMKELLGSCGDKITVKPPFHCDYGYNIFVGDDLFLNFDCIFLDAAPIRIGAHCMIGPKTCIYAIGHPLDAESRQKKIGIPKPVTIGDNVWIGGGVTILAGVSIGDNTVIGAGSVVTKSFPDHVVIAGNPARIIKHIED